MVPQTKSLLFPPSSSSSSSSFSSSLSAAMPIGRLSEGEVAEDSRSFLCVQVPHDHELHQDLPQGDVCEVYWRTVYDIICTNAGTESSESNSGDKEDACLLLDPRDRTLWGWVLNYLCILNLVIFLLLLLRHKAISVLFIYGSICAFSEKIETVGVH
jgi:hypothetical protein